MLPYTRKFYEWVIAMHKLMISVRSVSLAKYLAEDLDAGYDLYVCHTGPEALRYLETVQPDILIIDLGLPSIDGITTLNKSRHKPSVTVALTTYLSYKVELAAEAAGIDCLIMLPNSTKAILSNVYALADQKLHKKIPSPDT